MVQTLIDIAYLISAILFILGMKRLQSPATARSGNQVAAVGMLIAIVATLFLHRILTPVEMLVALVVGSALGVVMAQRVPMTQMPEFVAAFNGFGGLASALVAGAEVAKYLVEFGSGNPTFTTVAQTIEGDLVAAFDAPLALTIALSILIGAVTFSGSFVAFGKLSGKVSGNPVSFPGMRVLTVVLFVAAVGSTAYMMIGAGAFPAVVEPVVWSVVVLAAVSLLLGVLVVIPIGGADMPVVVSLLNSYSGMAAAMTGFVLDNTSLLVSGALVGASGLILTKIMCDAMNRSLLNVLLGGFGGDASTAAPVAGLQEGMTVSATSAEDTAIMLTYASKVIVVPGYGMAVAQAQHQVRELADLLAEKGVEVKYAIHPVAGRMPGHMNVLLAEANVPYDQLFEMDDINNEFATTDVVLVIGANDVVNPAARNDPSSPIYGMPILNVDNARTVVVLKRSMRPGYAGIENALFYLPNTRMLFGDAKESITNLVSEVKAL